MDSAAAVVWLAREVKGLGFLIIQPWWWRGKGQLVEDAEPVLKVASYPGWAECMSQGSHVAFPPNPYPPVKP